MDCTVHAIPKSLIPLSDSHFHFLNEAILGIKKTFGTPDICRQTGIHQVETRDAGQTPTMHKTVPITKNYSTQNVSDAKAENLYMNEKTLVWHEIQCRKSQRTQRNIERKN